MDRHLFQYMFTGIMGSCGFGGFGGYGMNNMSYMNSGFGGCGMGNIWDCNNSEIAGYAWGNGVVQGLSVFGSAMAQRREYNVAAKNNKAAKDNKAFNDALKVLGLDKTAVETLSKETIDAAVKINAGSELDKQLYKPVKDLETKKTTLQTEYDAAKDSISESALTALKAPNGSVGDPAKMIKQWENQKSTYTNAADKDKADDMIEQLQALKSTWDAWNDPDGTKFKELKKIDEDIKAAKEKYENDKKELEEGERTEAAKVANELLPLMKNKAYKQNKSDLDDADGCGLSRLFGKQHYTVGDTNTDGKITATDLRKLLHEYRKGDRTRQQEISTWLQNNPNIADAFREAAGDDRDKLSILNKVINGEAFTKDS